MTTPIVAYLAARNARACGGTISRDDPSSPVVETIGDYAIVRRADSWPFKYALRTNDGWLLGLLCTKRGARKEARWWIEQDAIREAERRGVA